MEKETDVLAVAFIPTVPYVIRSGKYKDAAVEILMFNNYPFLKFLYFEMNKNPTAEKNRLHQHLDWLMRQGENRKTRVLCPQCQQRKLRYFSARGSKRLGYSLSLIFTSCEKPNCIKKLESLSGGTKVELYPFRFSSIAKFRNRTDQRLVAELLRNAFDLPARLTAEAAFRFFLNS